ncbi:MAG TPA: HD-GYP domain-containing protein [Solirubrobacterales bacterium]|jgi:putative nucleotidyltransferase with HDIG domain|nr:HD-GYP domain-containing protein [Solirubrobacterales bacterium]
MADDTRPTRFETAGMLGVLALAIAAAIWFAPESNWDLPLFAILLVFSIFSYVTAVTTASKVKVSGAFLALVLAMVFLGGTAAAAIGVTTNAVGWFRWREEPRYLLNNLIAYAIFPLVAGLAFHAVVDAAGLTASDPVFYLLVFALFQFALALNFLLIAGYHVFVGRASFADQLRVLPAVMPSEFASAMLAVAVAFIYHVIGIAAIALFGVVLLTFQYLLGQLLLSQQRADELERRSKQLASFQVGMLSAMLRTLDLRDQMTARHSAAVARYSRAIAQRAGYSRQEEELVHIAALLHDIGKFILPDRILKANVPLTDEDWMLIKRHPQQGARVVSSLDGYGPVAEIILAHHERIDGKGYPRGLSGDDIPEFARIISVADTYDVMTARDSYRTPVSTMEAMQELRRVAGKQLDPRFVEVFIELLEGKDVSFQHGEAADFEKELALEARIEETANPEGNANRFGAPGVPVG